VTDAPDRTPPRVLMLTTSYPAVPGAASGPFVHRLAARLVAAGATVSVLAPGGPEARARIEDGVRIEFFRYAPRRLERLAHGEGIAANLAGDRRLAALLPSFLTAFATRARLLARGAEVVHAHWLPAGLVAAGTGRPRVVTVHGSDLVLGRRVPRLVRAAIGRGPALAVTESQVAELRALAPDADVRVVPPQGADVHPRPLDPADRRSVLFAGRLIELKGVATLAAAWPAVRAAVPGARLVVCGEGPLAHLLRLDGVELLGRVGGEELERRYGSAAVVCVPSLRDAFATVSLEAMAAGRPVVCTPVGAMAARVRDGVDGLHVPPGDAPALATAIAALLADPARAAAMGASAAARVGERYAWDAVIGATLAAYGSAMRAKAE
jgi:glycosyltransferase involved in cell wall biosynthesis